MLHRSTSASPLSFDLGGRHYDVPAGGDVDIPARYAYAVRPRGLPLVPTGPAPAAGEEGTPAVGEDGVVVWRARADRLAAELDEVSVALSQEREAREGFVAELRATLGIEPGASILDAIRALLPAATAPQRATPAGNGKRGASIKPTVDAPAPPAEG